MDITTSTNYIVRTNAIQAYLKDIKRYSVITKQEETDLFNKFEDSKNRLKQVQNTKDVPNKQSIINYETKLQEEIRNEIIMRNQRFNFAVAKRYDNNEILMDLVNVGTIGMYEAFEKFNYKEGIRFCSFAVWYIRRAINAFLVKENLTVRTTNVTRYMPKVKKIENEFYLKNGRKPSGAEVIDILHDKYGIEVTNESDIYGVQVESIDASFNDEEDFTYDKSSEFATFTASENNFEETIEMESLSESTRRALKKLTERERIILCMYAGYGYNKEYKDKEIGDIIGLTSERVRQLRHSAMKKFASAYKVSAI